MFDIGKTSLASSIMRGCVWFVDLDEPQEIGEDKLLGCLKPFLVTVEDATAMCVPVIFSGNVFNLEVKNYTYG